ncbi:MAG: zf-TFIIB domain-containing protein [Candidatus Cloacimonetes bacterium]|nr:zf-TFIIB domain-containing protein [Candidatus Cloacimonadota bacterium]
MNCPRCGKSMITLEIKEVEIDYCLSCHGIWLDNGELELLLRDAKRKEKLLQSFLLTSVPGEKPLKCPVCHKKMLQVMVKKVLLDKCRHGHGLWFDNDELQKILEMGDFDPDNTIKKHLTEIFNNKEAKGE